MSSELGNIVDALRWYSQPVADQYHADQAARYDNAARTLTDRTRFAEQLAAAIGPDAGTTLEIAAGTGLVSEVLLTTIDDITFTDLEAAPLAILRRRLGKAAIVRADFYSLPFANESFDTVVGVGMYRYVDMACKTLFWNEMYRVVKPGGRVFLSQFYPRGFSLRGSDIVNDVLNCNDRLFTNTLAQKHSARTNIGPFSVKSGTYRSYELQRN